ncbi:MAG: endonuclease domain-containing protein [Phascolarctobacterium sp.]|nr:endonuclease domain-containing protein [Phascolarctobacterium sp.]
MYDYNSYNVKFARKLRKNMIPWENKLWYQFLRGYEVRFQRQKVIQNYIVDFFCTKALVAVELDGGGHYSPKKEEQDRIRAENLAAQNIKLIRFSNLDVDNNFYAVCSEIDRVVKDRINSHPQSQPRS